MTEAPKPSLAIFQVLLETAADRRPRMLARSQQSALEVKKTIEILGFKPVDSSPDSGLIRYESDDPSMRGVMVHGLPVSFLEGTKGNKPVQLVEYRAFPRLPRLGIE